MTATREHKPLTILDGIAIGILIMLALAFLAWRLG